MLLFQVIVVKHNLHDATCYIKKKLLRLSKGSLLNKKPKNAPSGTAK